MHFRLGSSLNQSQCYQIVYLMSRSELAKNNIVIHRSQDCFKELMNMTWVMNRTVIIFRMVVSRRSRHPLVTCNEEWTIRYQIVVLKFYWSEIRSLAHDIWVLKNLPHWSKPNSDVSQLYRDFHT